MTWTNKKGDLSTDQGWRISGLAPLNPADIWQLWGGNQAVDFVGMHGSGSRDFSQVTSTVPTKNQCIGSNFNTKVSMTIGRSLYQWSAMYRKHIKFFMKHRHYNHYKPRFTSTSQSFYSPGRRSMECTRLWAIGRHAPFLGGNPLIRILRTGGNCGGTCLDGVRLKLVKASKWMGTSCESIFVEWCSRCFISPNVFFII
jgi:hypothetical protein